MQSRRSSAMCVGGPPKPMQPIRPHSRRTIVSPGGGSAVLGELVAEASLDAEIAAGDVVVVRRADLDDVAVLDVQGEVAADAAVRADRVDLLLGFLLPRSGLA